MSEDLVHVVAIPWDMNVRGREKSPVERYVDVETVVIMPKGSKDPAQAIHATWTKPLTSVLKNAFGLSEETTGLIAAFPREAITGSNELVFVFVSPIGEGGKNGREWRETIPAKDIAAWR